MLKFGRFMRAETAFNAIFKVFEANPTQQEEMWKSVESTIDGKFSEWDQLLNERIGEKVADRIIVPFARNGTYFWQLL